MNCPDDQAPRTYSHRYARRIAAAKERNGDPPQDVIECGDHYHVQETPTSLSSRITQGLRGHPATPT